MKKNAKPATHNDSATRASSSSHTHSATLTGPTLLTLTRMVIAVIFVILVTLPSIAAKIFALALFILGAISDLVDGKWARKYAKVTDLGAFLDPLADKMLINLAFLALVALDVIPLWVFAVILVRDFTVDGMRMMVARAGVTVAASFYGKLKTTLQLTALIIILFNLIVHNPWLTILGDLVLYAALILTVWSGADYLWQGYKTLAKKQK